MFMLPQSEIYWSIHSSWPYPPPQLTCVTFLHSPAKSSPALILILVILLHLPSIPAHVKMKLPAVTNSCHAARFPVMIMVYINMIIS